MWTKLLLIGLIGFILALFFVLGGPDYLNLTTIQSYTSVLSDAVERHFGLSIILTMLVYITVVALSLPGAAILSLLVGFIFGRWLGWVLLIISATIGALLVFWLVRYLFSDWANRKLASASRAQNILEGFERHAVNYLLFLRLVPAFPFWLVNLAMALTPISSRQYVMGTFFGIMPGSFVFANLGQSLAALKPGEPLLSIELIVALALLGCLMLLPLAVNRYTDKRS